MFGLATLGAKKSAKGSGSKAKAAQLRVQKDLSEMTKSKNWSLDFSDVNDLLNSKLTISPDEGYYKGGKFTFSFKVGLSYPHEPPKVRCETKVYHPNIDHDGNVCLNILREDWNPVLTLNAIIYGLEFLLTQPNPDDPLNKEAAELMKTNLEEFERNVQRSLRDAR